jgi:hypothetical protein
VQRFVWDNRNATGTVPAARQLCRELGVREIIHKSAVTAGHTGDTNETIVRTITIDAGSMGANGQIHGQFWIAAAANNGNIKTVRVRWGGISGTVVSQHVLTSLVSRNFLFSVMNQNNASAQLLGMPITTAGGLGTSTGSMPTATLDTTAAVDLVVTVELADSSDTVNLRAGIVELAYGA